ncbi:MAG: hypothetical protein WCL32_02625 [Planctomycetota bacterium]
MVPQVTVIGILMIINGSLAIVMGSFLAAVGPFMFTMMKADQNRGGMAPGEENILTGMMIGYVTVGIAVFLCGLLNVIAGIRALKFRNRTFVIVALFSNFVPLFTCYCLPTSMGLMIYGLIVMFQTDVAQAFELGSQGLSNADIQDHFYRARHRDRYDDDERQDRRRLPPPEAPEAPEGPIDQRIQ